MKEKLPKLTSLQKRNVILAQKRTTIQVEYYVWSALERITDQINIPFSHLLEHVYYNKHDLPMAQSLRLVAILYFSNQAAKLAKHPADKNHNQLTLAESGQNEDLQSFDEALTSLYYATCKG